MARPAGELPESRARAEGLFLLGAILLLGYLTFLIFKPFVDWVILGFLFAYLFYKPYQGALAIVRRRGPAAALVVVLVLLLFFLPFIVVITYLVRDVSGFAQTFTQIDLQAVLVGTLASIAGAFGLTTDAETLSTLANTISAQVQARAANFFADFAAELLSIVTKVLVGLFIFGFTLFYGFVDGARIVQAIRDVIPLHGAEKDLLLHEIRTVTNAVFIGHLLVSVIQATVGTVGFVVLGVPRAIFWGFVMLLTSIVPFIGPFLVWIPVGLYLLVTEGPVDGLLSDNRTFAALGVLLVVGPLASTIDNIVRPKLVGSRADVHPFLILVGAIGGLFVLGFTGFVVGPLVLALFAAVLRVYRAHWRGREEHAALVASGTPARGGVRSRSATKRKR